MQRKGKASGIGLIFFAGIMFAFLGVGWLLLQIEPRLFDFPLPVWGLVQYATHWSTVIAIWLLLAIVFVARAKSAMHYDVFAANRWPTSKQWFLALILVAASVALSVWRWGGQIYMVHALSEARQNHPSFSTFAFFFEIAYSAFRCIVFVLGIAFAQEAGNRLSGNPRIPWGAIAIFLVWGGAQLLLHGMPHGLVAAAQCALMGAVYLVCGRNLRIAFPLILLMALF